MSDNLGLQHEQGPLTDENVTYARGVADSVLTETCYIAYYWTDYRANANEDFTPHKCTASSVESQCTDDADLKREFADVPCLAIGTPGTTYADADGESYSLSGMDFLVSPGVGPFASYETQKAEGITIGYTGHFVHYAGGVWTIRSVEEPGTIETHQILHCTETPRDHRITPEVADTCYLLKEDYTRILLEDGVHGILLE